jgi:bifunctional UDP-N-acetylglucosamine pyrophosphorylase/glucosamine-1-phosphate N-acetyltransferase
VTIGRDTVIGPGTVLEGSTSIGERCQILYAVLRDSEVHDDVQIGPFAYLRPGSVVRDGAKIGTSVELKNSDIGAGSKVPHLSYIGDTDVGEGSNLGASTITANYDGKKKHRTKLGKSVKTSVHTSLVAPLNVGDRAYTGASSAITEDVPDGALAIARQRQKNIEGYADRKDQEDSQK